MFLLVCVYLMYVFPFSFGVEINSLEIILFRRRLCFVAPPFFGMSCGFPGLRLSHPPHVRACMLGFMTSREVDDLGWG